MLLKSGGTAVAFGCNVFNACTIPALPAGIRYSPATPTSIKVFQAECDFRDDGVHLRLLGLSGHENWHLLVPRREQLAAVQRQCMLLLGVSSAQHHQHHHHHHRLPPQPSCYPPQREANCEGGSFFSLLFALISCTFLLFYIILFSRLFAKFVFVILDYRCLSEPWIFWIL